VRFIAYIEGKDRPGLLRDVTIALTDLGSNIVFSVGFSSEGTSYLLFILQYEGSASELEDILNTVKDIESVDVEEAGPEAADLLAKYIEEFPAITKELTKYLHPSEFLDILVRLDEPLRHTIYPSLGSKYLGQLLRVAPQEIIEEVCRYVHPKVLAQALVSLNPDEQADILQLFPKGVRRAVIQYIPPEVLESVRSLLKYPPESAGGIMTSNVPVLHEEQKVSDALELLRKRHFEVFDVIYIVSKEGKLVGYAYVADLLKEKPNSRLSKVARRDYVAVDPFDDREVVARLMIKYDLTRIPVVDVDGKFLGVITIDDVADVIIAEESEDLFMLSGISKVGRSRYLTARVKDLFKRRFLWLLLIYLIESFTARIIQGYSGLISRVAILAAFIPLIIGTGGNAGAQASALITRALALGEVTARDVLRVVVKELLTCGLLALGMASIGFIFAFSISFNVVISIIVAIALASVIVIADIIGALLPLIASSLDLDPAVLSGPLITTVVDVAGLFTYFLIATTILTI